MKHKKKIMLSSLLLSCLHGTTPNASLQYHTSRPQSKSENGLENNFSEQKKQEVILPSPQPKCPQEMANIEDLFCIDRYEASIVDKNTGEEASPHYIPSQQETYDADWQYEFFIDKEIDQKKIPDLVKENQPLAMPARSAEQYPGFEPMAVSAPGKIPATYVTKVLAEQACANAGKRLCTRKEWYKTCVGPEGPASYLNEKGEEEFPEAYPYGLHYEKRKCNIGLHPGRWPPGLLGRKNNQEMLDPRIGALLGQDGLPMKRETDAFPGCANEHQVYNLVGNVHEIVADIHIAKRFPKERITMVGSHYARAETQSCAEATTGHWKYYTDYSIGFRCCKDI